MKRPFARSRTWGCRRLATVTSYSRIKTLAAFTGFHNSSGGFAGCPSGCGLFVFISTLGRIKNWANFVVRYGGFGTSSSMLPQHSRDIMETNQAWIAYSKPRISLRRGHAAAFAKPRVNAFEFENQPLF